MHTLILLRHGESEWNSKNLFTGWVDVGLTSGGEDQARRSGELLRTAGLEPDAAHTSALTRAVRTAELALGAAGRAGIPLTRTWRLNERHYGALTGRDKKAVRQEHGEEQFDLWRRSYDTAPPPIAPGDDWHVSDDPRYAGPGHVTVPRTESLADVGARLLPHWRDAVVPELRAGRTVLVVAHSNSLRALAAHLDGLGRDEVMRLNIPTGIPLLYELDAELSPVERGGRYLDRDAAARAAREVADQGR